MRKIKWGVLSTARIGVKKVIPALLRSKHCDVRAISSRDPARASDAAQRLGIPGSYGSYEELLRDPEIEAIYNPLPNHLHVPWSIEAMNAGKHVLCEKPIGLSSTQAQELLRAAARHPGLKVMEAFMYRFHPQWQQALKLVRTGKIGELRSIQTFFSYYNTDPSDIRNNLDWGGGGLMDIGCYPISLSRFIFGGEPERVLGRIEYDPDFGIDRMASAVLDFGSGTSTFTCATQLVPFQRVNVFGTRGRVEIEIPFNAPPDRPCRIWHQDGEEAARVEFPVCDQYALQGDEFSLSILHNTEVPTPLEDAVANMRVIEAVFESGKSGSWTRVET